VGPYHGHVPRQQRQAKLGARNRGFSLRSSGTSSTSPARPRHG
jgi:hypothetical protein